MYVLWRHCNFPLQIDITGYKNRNYKNKEASVLHQKFQFSPSSRVNVRYLIFSAPRITASKAHGMFSAIWLANKYSLLLQKHRPKSTVKNVGISTSAAVRDHWLRLFICCVCICFLYWGSYIVFQNHWLHLFVSCVVFFVCLFCLGNSAVFRDHWSPHTFALEMGELYLVMTRLMMGPKIVPTKIQAVILSTNNTRLL